MNRRLPHETNIHFVAWTGLETDLIFNHGVDVPGFASFPLLDQPAARKVILDGVLDQMRVVAAAGLGTILESPTWMANRDRAAPFGYSGDRLVAANRDAIALMAEAREKSGSPNILVSGNIGPQGDGYDPATFLNVAEAQDYHGEQVAAFAGTKADLVSAYTLTYPAEAIGFVRASKAAGIAAVVSFTVETDGNLVTGQSLADAIAETDAASENGAAYFMVNCAHPDHFRHVLTADPRLKGIIVNASRCSHAELDEAEELDAGDPMELGDQVAEITRAFPNIRIVGGCCGTDARHLGEIAKRVAAT